MLYKKITIDPYIDIFERLKMKSLLEIKNMSVSFNHNNKDIEIIRKLSYTIAPNEIVGILGESGSGKTVSAQSILGLIDQTQGAITADYIHFKGKDISKMNDKALSAIRGKEISYIFQNPSLALNPYKKISSQLKETLKAHKVDFNTQTLTSVLESVGIDNPLEMLKRYPFQLSGGQNQRIMIAASIICNPQLLIADEPTSSIDASLRKKVLDLFKKINTDLNISMIIITHDFEVANYICDRIIVMYGGVIVEEGSTTDIINHPLHPYTKELLSCVHSLESVTDTLYTLNGSPIDPSLFKNQCPFLDRCSRAIEKCKGQMPKLKSTNERKIRCYLQGGSNE